MRRSAPKLRRLTKRAEFLAAAGNGRRFRSPELTVQVLDRPADEQGVRLGVTASRHVGNAVKRNRIRRRLKAAAREAFAAQTAAVDVVLVARPEALSCDYSALVRAAADAITRAKPQKPAARERSQAEWPRKRPRDETQTVMMNREDNKNLLLAIVLSAVVLIGWNYFYAVPQMEQQRKAAQPTQGVTTPGSVTPTPGAAPTASTPGAPAVSGGPAAVVTPGTAPGLVTGTREAALAASPRVRIDTPAITGSFALTGARIDDVSLKRYHETVDPRSPLVVIKSPVGGPNPYYADFGWTAAPGTNVALPTAQTVWTADRDLLTPTQPVTLTWDNGQGLVFTRVVRVDANAMFTIEDSVANRGGQPITLFPYGLVARHGKPITQGYYVLHEGLIGVLGDQGLQEYTYDNVLKEGVLGGSVRGKVWRDVQSGFIGITDKYWATAVIPDQTRKYEAASRSTPPSRRPSRPTISARR